MLNGISPIIIFNIGALPPSSKTFKAISGIPLIGSTLAQNIGLPIPIYLDEKLTGVYVKSQSTQVDMNEEISTKENEKTPDVNQRAINSIVTVNMLAIRGSIVASMLIALNDLIFTKLTSKTYTVSYLNGSTLVLGALVHGFSATENEENDKLDIVFQFSKANKKVDEIPTFFLPKITGSTPVPPVTP